MYPDNNINNGGNGNNFKVQDGGLNNIQLQNNQNNGLYNGFNQGQVNGYMHSNNSDIQGNDKQEKSKSNKKILLIILLLVIFVVIVLVVVFVLENKNSNSGNIDNNLSNDKVDATPNENEQNDENNILEEDKMKQFKLPRIPFYCKAPIECVPVNNGRSVITSLNNSYIAAIFTGDKGKLAEELEDILVSSSEQFARDVNDYLMTNIEADALIADTTERVTVSGYEAVKFTGNITNISNWKYQIYGYSMVIEDRMVIFLGILTSEEQRKVDLEDMRELIDLMATTIYK